VRIQPPKVDDRTASDIAADVRRLLARDLPALDAERQGAAAALVNVFARFGEILIDRINRAADKNFLSFLDLLGISPAPQQAARAPVTFYLADGRLDETVVPKLTQVAAEQGKGEQTQVIFETERELVVVSTRLDSLFAKYGENDQYVDYSPVFPQIEQAKEGKLFAPPKPASQLIPHVLYIGLRFPSTLSALDELKLHFVLEESGSVDARAVGWGSCRQSPEGPHVPQGSSDAGKKLELRGTVVLTPAGDTTENLRKSGDVVFENLQPWSPVIIGGVAAQWLSCTLQTPISYKSGPTPHSVRESHLPHVQSFYIVMRSQRDALAPVYAFANRQKLDLTKDFYPFGEKPRFGDAFYLACDEAFSLMHAQITLRIALTNPTVGGAEPTIPRSNPRGIRLRWEFWDGQTWAELGTSDLSQVEPPRLRIKILGESEEDKPATNFTDGTRALSESDKEVTFRFQRPPQKIAVNGQQGYWIRVRIIAGDYGRDAYFEREAGKGYAVVPSTVSPPSISKISISYSLFKVTSAEALLTYNDWQFARLDATKPIVHCFTPVLEPDRIPMVFFGFSLPGPIAESSGTTAVSARRTPFPVRSMSIYAGVEPDGLGWRPPAVSSQTSVEWQYWNGLKWMKWIVRDETLGLRRSGLIRFLAPPDFALKKEFGEERYWLRVRQREAAFRANLGVVALNTTMAAHCTTVANEILGASNGQPNQRFRTTRAPVLEGQVLQVREQTWPSTAERARIIKDEGADAIQRIATPAGKGDEFWICWHEVQNFYHSGPRDRHYTLDRTSGQITFGDATNGIIPPPLAGNIRMESYRTGGGAVGNKPALTIKQLKSSVPYIQSVMNWEGADGGADAESECALLERGPTQIRHGGRAVTKQDFEDLAKRVSPKVARAMCVPLYDLIADPTMQDRKPGTVSVIVVPQSSEPKPFPNSDLLLQVQSSLESLCPTTTTVNVLGPEYAAADVEATIAVLDPDTAGDVKLGVTLALKRYLHPLTGGRDQTGWDFGCVPQKSELFRLIDSIPGVDHVIELKLVIAEDRTPVTRRERLIICTGLVEVSAVLVDEE